MLVISDYKLFALKVVIFYSLLSIFSCLAGIKIWLIKEKNSTTIFSKIVGAMLIVSSIVIAYPALADFIIFDIEDKVIIVREVNSPGKAGIFYSYVIVDGTSDFKDLYNRFKFVAGDNYFIKYLPRTKVILDASKIY